MPSKLNSRTASHRPDRFMLIGIGGVYLFDARGDRLRPRPPDWVPAGPETGDFFERIIRFYPSLGSNHDFWCLDKTSKSAR